jgi:hypothetical protein
VADLPQALLPVWRMAGALKLPLLIASLAANRRAPLHAPNFPIVLLISEKAGCTTLTKWFLFQVRKLDESSRFHPWVHEYRRSVLNRQPGYRWNALRLTLFGEKPMMKLVRDPYDRAASSFLETLSYAGREGGNAWALKLIAAARAQAGKGEIAVPALSFRDFTRYLARTGTEWGQINGHVARQHMAGEDGRIDRIIKLECFAEEIRQIESEYGLIQSPLPSLTDSGHHRSKLQRTDLVTSLADIEFTSDQIRDGRVPNYEILYDDETRRLVAEAFAADFGAYGYDIGAPDRRATSQAEAPEPQALRRQAGISC